MNRRALVSPFAALLLAAVGIASAQNAYTSRPMNVRAGPDREYPLVAQLPPGAPVNVNGCISDWSWCDVSFDGNRGWVYSGGLSYVYQGERVPFYSYAPSFGLPIVTFSLGAYWDDYYRGRPWYSQRSVWIHRRLPPHMRPATRPHAGPPPMQNARRPGGAPPQGARGEERGRTMAPERSGRPAPHGPTRQARPPEGNAHAPQRGGAPQKKGPSRSRGNSDRDDHGEHGGGR